MLKVNQSNLMYRYIEYLLYAYNRPTACFSKTQSSHCCLHFAFSCH